jgi:hypothetical protein
MESPRPLQLARPFPAEASELEQPGPLAGTQQELAALQVRIARGPVRLASVPKGAPAAAGDFLERCFRLADKARDPAFQAVLRPSRRIDQQIAELDHVRRDLRPAPAMAGARTGRQRSAMASEEVDAPGCDAAVFEEVGDCAERAAGQARPLVDHRKPGRRGVRQQLRRESLGDPDPEVRPLADRAQGDRRGRSERGRDERGKRRPDGADADHPERRAGRQRHRRRGLEVALGIEREEGEAFRALDAHRVGERGRRERPNLRLGRRREPGEAARPGGTHGGGDLCEQSHGGGAALRAGVATETRKRRVRKTLRQLAGLDQRGDQRGVALDPGRHARERPQRLPKTAELLAGTFDSNLVIPHEHPDRSLPGLAGA